MKIKNQNKCYYARVVTLIIALTNIYQIFCPITLPKHMLIANIYNTPSGDFYATRIQSINTLEHTMQRPATFLFY